MVRKLSLLTAGGLVALSVGVAGAQTGAGSTSSPGASANQGKCWDQATNQIKDKSAMAGSGSASGLAGSGATGSATTGSGMSGSTSGSTSGSASGSGAAGSDRPAAAIGLPNC